MVAKNKERKKFKLDEDAVFQGIFILLTIVLVGFLIVSNYKISEKRSELTARINELTGQLQELEDEKQRLEEGISETQKDTYWEEKIREQGYVKEGEEQVVVLDEDENKKQEPEKEQGFFSNLLASIKEFFRKFSF